MPDRQSKAVWEGDLKGGHGTVRLGSGAFEGAYTYASRFEQGIGTNPEELVGAAHAGCFSMFLAGLVAKAGQPARRIDTTADVHLEVGPAGARITRIRLNCVADIPGADARAFAELAAAAKRDCPVSQALGGVTIELDARLQGT